MKRIFRTATLCCLLLAGLSASAQYVTVLPQQNLSKWGMLTANYSGLTRIEDDTYAIVDDKSAKEGFYLLEIIMNPTNGEIESVTRSALFGPSNPEYKSIYADCEDIIYRPDTKTLFITHENTGQIKEYSLQGEPTGRELQIPPFLIKEHQNVEGGLEALAYNDKTQTFWTTTETSLNEDKTIQEINGFKHQPLRIVAFNKDLQTAGQWAYLMDTPKLNQNNKYYTHGVPAMTALPDGRLLVMERELSVPKNYMGAKCEIAIYVVNPQADKALPDTTPLHKVPRLKYLKKQPVTTFNTSISLKGLNYANYEGMCLGPQLSDGRQTLLLVNDSQAGTGNSLYTLKDYIKVIILPTNF